MANHNNDSFFQDVYTNTSLFYDKSMKSDKFYDQFQVTCIITGPGANN